jgi:TfoX/Sxy family transcriptional regulator of competence genes
MATQQTTIDILLENMSMAGNVRARKMFGEYALYCEEKVVALVCDDQLFVKMNPTSLTFLDETPGAPPYPAAKNYLCVPEEKWNDREWLSRFIHETADSLPLPKPKKK